MVIILSCALMTHKTKFSVCGRNASDFVYCPTAYECAEIDGGALWVMRWTPGREVWVLVL